MSRNISIQFAEWIEELGVTQVSKLLEVNIRTVSYWKAGKHLPTKRMAREIVQKSWLKMEDIHGC
jgi:hypothetical protein